MSKTYVPIGMMVVLVVVGATAQAYATVRGIDLSRSSGQLWHFTFSYAVALWVEFDRRSRNIFAPFEYSAFMFFAWPILAPCYLYQSRRWRGLALGIGLVLFSSIPDLVSIAIYELSSNQ